MSDQTAIERLTDRVSDVESATAVTAAVLGGVKEELQGLRIDVTATGKLNHDLVTSLISAQQEERTAAIEAEKVEKAAVIEAEKVEKASTQTRRMKMLGIIGSVITALASGGGVAWWATSDAPAATQEITQEITHHQIKAKAMP